MRLYIDGSLVLDHWTDQATTQYTAQQSLAAGAHVITVEYYENTGWSSAHLSWQKM
jgi:mannan endo-1,4-beta-mannosidase